LRQSQRPNGTARPHAHFGDALEGCLTSASQSLTSSFAQLLGRCVALLQEYVASQDAASDSKEGAVAVVADAKADALAEALLRVCALDYELSDHAMLHDSGLLQVHHALCIFCTPRLGVHAQTWSIGQVSTLLSECHDGHTRSFR
jgi:hypothetical protein